MGDDVFTRYINIYINSRHRARHIVHFAARHVSDFIDFMSSFTLFRITSTLSFLFVLSVFITSLIWLQRTLFALSLRRFLILVCHSGLIKEGVKCIVSSEMASC